jgi:hypothetical protein
MDYKTAIKKNEVDDMYVLVWKYLQETLKKVHFLIYMYMYIYIYIFIYIYKGFKWASSKGKNIL